MNEELKSMLQGLTTEQLREVAELVGDLIQINEDSAGESAEPVTEPSEEVIPFNEDDDL